MSLFTRITPKEANRLESVLIKWRGDEKNVILTGDFDNWSASTQMDYNEIDQESRQILRFGVGEKHWFKFLVDGEWRCSLDYPCEEDGQGYYNNYILISK